MEFKSFREQLQSIRSQVEAAERDREQRRREERERVKEKLAEELKHTPPDLLFRQLKAIEEEYKSANKRFCPVEAIRAALERLDAFEQQIRRYRQYQSRYPDIYSEPMNRAIDQLSRGIEALRKTIGPQWEQWEKALEVVGAVTFRPRKKADDPKLVELAKGFQERAHSMQLDIPKSFFAAKRENFYVAEVEGQPVAYFEYYPEERRLSFAVAPRTGTNFLKLVRALVPRFCHQGPLPAPLESVQVRIYSRQEVRFYTDLGFMKSETLGMSDWLYQAKLQ